MGAVATLDLPAASAMTFAIATRQAGTSISNTVGSIQFAAGSSTGTFSAGFNPTVALGAGGLLTITAPSTVDPNAAGLEIAIPYSLK